MSTIICPYCMTENSISMATSKYNCTSCPSLRPTFSTLMPYLHRLETLVSTRGCICTYCNGNSITVAYVLYQTDTRLYILKDVLWCNKCHKCVTSRSDLERAAMNYLGPFLRKREAALAIPNLKKIVLAIKDIPQKVLLERIKREYLFKAHIYDRILNYNKKEEELI